jgi:hypothetical protein
MPEIDTPSSEILDALRRMGLLTAGTNPSGERLTGGVSSDIWRIDLPTGPICVKRALAKLRVAADWHAPVERNRYEARWMQRANAAVPGAAPALLGLDQVSGTLAMQHLPPDDHPLWKTQLHDGDADPAFAAQVAASLGQIHAATAADPTVAADFPTDRIFYDIRGDRRRCDTNATRSCASVWAARHGGSVVGLSTGISITSGASNSARWYGCSVVPASP